MNNLTRDILLSPLALGILWCLLYKRNLVNGECLLIWELLRLLLFQWVLCSLTYLTLVWFQEIAISPMEKHTRKDQDPQPTASPTLPAIWGHHVQWGSSSPGSLQMTVAPAVRWHQVETTPLSLAQIPDAQSLWAWDTVVLHHLHQACW